MTAANAATRPRTESRAVRRKQLIEATIKAIATHGLTGTTMATVTRLADVSMGLVSFHFQSKENLLHETLLYLAEEHRTCWQDLAAAVTTPEAKLAAVIDAHFHPTTCSDDRIRVWFAFFGEARYRAVYRTHITDFDSERTDFVAGLCRDLIDRGRHGLDADQTAGTIESLADGLWLSIMLYPDALPRAAAKQQVQSYLASVFPAEFAVWPGQTDLRETGT